MVELDNGARTALALGKWAQAVPKRKETILAYRLARPGRAFRTTNVTLRWVEGWHRSLAVLDRAAESAAASVEWTAPSSRTEVGERFAELAATWKRETVAESSVHRMAMHTAYQQIIGLGHEAVPLILRELEREPDYWFWALTAITGEDPAAGDNTLSSAAERWLDWGRSRRLI